MKKRDFLAGMCCGFLIARVVEFDLYNLFQIITVALVVLALSSLWEWIRSVTTKNTSGKVSMQRLKKYS